jgi:hypothetical protein
VVVLEQSPIFLSIVGRRFLSSQKILIKLTEQQRAAEQAVQCKMFGEFAYNSS